MSSIQWRYVKKITRNDKKNRKKNGDGSKRYTDTGVVMYELSNIRDWYI